MRALTLDYARPARAPLWLGVLVLAAGVVMAGWAAAQYWKVSEEVAIVEQGVRTLERRAAKAPRQLPRERRDSRESQRALAQARAVWERLERPWPQLFRAIESAGHTHVALLRIEPDGAKGLVRITAEASALGDMLEYVRGLERTGVVTQVHVMDHEVQQRLPGHPVRFAVSASWGRTP